MVRGNKSYKNKSKIDVLTCWLFYTRNYYNAKYSKSGKLQAPLKVCQHNLIVICNAMIIKGIYIALNVCHYSSILMLAENGGRLYSKQPPVNVSILYN